MASKPSIKPKLKSPASKAGGKPRRVPKFDYDSPEFTEALSRHFHAAKRAALSKHSFTLLPVGQFEPSISHGCDYGSSEFPKELTKKFHQGTKKAVAQARKAGLLESEC